MMDDRTDQARAVGIWIVAIVAAAFALYFGREFFVPIAFAILLSVLFRPVVRWMERLHIPAVVGSTIVTLALVIAMAAGAYALTGPIQTWVRTAPERLSAAEQKLSRF